MTDIKFRSDFSVDLVQNVGSDDSVLQAMLISTIKDYSVNGMADKDKLGKIRFLMRNRHGTPFEHNSMTFRVEAPIVVFREWHRHRIGISINEQSGRYVELPPMFYIPPPERPLAQIGKPGAYEYVPGNELQSCMRDLRIREANRIAYRCYQEMLNDGIAKEVARMVLPVNIYSSMYWTCNARSLMAFLSLRIKCPEGKRQVVEKLKYEPDGAGGSDLVTTATYSEWNRPEDDEFGWSMFPSKPMWEIDQCARAMENVFASIFPLTHAAFIEFGRVAP